MVMRLGMLDVAAVGAGVIWPSSDSYAALVSQKNVESSAHTHVHTYKCHSLSREHLTS